LRARDKFNRLWTVEEFRGSYAIVLYENGIGANVTQDVCGIRNAPTKYRCTKKGSKEALEEIFGGFLSAQTGWVIE